MKKILFLIVLALAAAYVIHKQTQRPLTLDEKQKIEEAITPNAIIQREEKSGPVVSGTFAHVSERAWATIPKLSDLQKLPKEELHHTPKLIQDAALALGDLAQLIHDKPEYRHDGLEFYKKCAAENTFPMSIRAACLKNSRKLGAELSERMDESALPQRLKMLTDRLEN